MAVILRNTILKDVGKVPQTIISTGPGERVTVIGLSCTNLKDSFIYVDILLQDDSSVLGYYVKNTLVSANSSLRAVNQGEKLIVAPNNELLVRANVDDAIDVICSIAEVV
jgi:hypothetical protein